MLSWIGTSAIILVFSVVALQLFLVGYLASKILPGETSDFILEIPPLRVPKLYNILIKTYTRVEWFLIEAVPLFLMGTFVLFVFHKIGLLAFLEQSASPIISGLLDLPPEGVKGFLLGFLRRDYGAAGFYQLAREGKLDHIQMIVSLVVITLFVPCIANFFVIIKERGFKTAIAIVAFIIPYSILVGAILNWILRALGVVL
jgi:ferrous iron transport protein B